MKKALLSTLAILFVATIDAQLGRDYRNEVIPDQPPTVITKVEAVCCCEWNFQIGSPSSDGRLLFVEDSMEIYINEMTMLNQDVSGILASLGDCIGSHITIKKESDPTTFVNLEITDGYDAGAEWEYSVQFHSGSGTFTKFTNVCVEFDWSCGTGDDTTGYLKLTGTDPGAPMSGFVEFDVLTGETYLAPTAGGLGLFAENGAFATHVIAANDEVLIDAGDTASAVSMFIHPHHIRIQGSGDFPGEEYTNHYWANYTEYSQPDKGYVDSLVNDCIPLTGTIPGNDVSGDILMAPGTGIGSVSGTGDAGLFWGTAAEWVSIYANGPTGTSGLLISPGEMTFTSSDTTSKGVTCDSDPADYVASSLVKKSYVDGLISASSLQSVCDADSMTTTGLYAGSFLTGSTPFPFGVNPDGSLEADSRVYVWDNTHTYETQIWAGILTSNRVNMLPNANGVLAVSLNGLPTNVAGDLTLQFDNIAHAVDAADAVIKFNLLLDYCEAIGLMAAP